MLTADRMSCALQQVIEQFGSLAAAYKHMHNMEKEEIGNESCPCGRYPALDSHHVL